METCVQEVSGLTRFARIERLRQRLIGCRPQVCVERAVLITEAYREFESEPMVLRRAHALQRILENITIYIDDDELIVGNIASRPRSAPIYPEFSVQWILDQMDSFSTRSGDKLFIGAEDKQLLREVLPWWTGRTVADRILGQVPEAVHDAIHIGAFSSYNMISGGVGHFIPGYERVLSLGLKGIREDIQQRLAEIDATDPDGIEKSWFYRAAIIACESVTLFANRYAHLARRLMNEERDSVRRAELEEVARVCDWVPENPPRSLHEALQSFWFTHMIPYIEANGLAVSPGRFDQYLLPFLQRDMDVGRVNEESALELLECLWIKFPNIIKLYDNKAAESFGGFPTNNCITLGGQTPAGDDATNELSYLCLQATADTRLPDPSLAVRMHRFSPDEFVRKACEVIRIGTGMPKIFNDEVIIPAMLSRGYGLHHARDYGIVGCVEPSVGGKTYGWCNAAYFSLVKCFELALNNGTCRQSGRASGVLTMHAEEFTSMEDVLAAYTQQVSHFVALLVQCVNITDLSHRELAPLPFSSCLYEGCTSNGVDLNAGGALYNFSSIQGVGTANVADSMIAIQNYVFEDGTISMQELLAALRSNFAGFENLRQRLLYKVPKYGNDDPRVDLLAREASSIYSREVERSINPRGGSFQPGLFPVTANIALGRAVGATPDGRAAGEALADGVSPCAGRDTKGPTATMKSVARLEHIRASNGTLLNLKLSPSVVAGATGLSKLMKLLRGYVTLGGWHVQFNIIEARTLREAQLKPEEYRDLVVRVAGYSAFFVELDKAVQENIIGRTTHEM